MPTEIRAIQTGGGDLPAEALTISGDCEYRFSKNGWNWFVERYGDKITTKDISNAEHMFSNSSNLTEIPFDLNFSSSEISNHSLTSIFNECNNITKLPKLNNVKISGEFFMFNGCFNLRTIPEDIADTWDWSYLESQTEPYNGS